MNIDTQVHELFDFALSRRNMVRGSVVAGSVAMATTAGLSKAFAQDLTDVDILQFALTLEHLEARMYKEMLAKNILTGKDLMYMTSFGGHEAAHVKAISDTLISLGATPVAPKDNYNFPEFNTREAILQFAKVAEDTGVGAYQGAAAAISNKAILAAAGSIVQVEARHAAIINILLGIDPVPTAVTNSLTIDQVNAIVGPILGA